MITNLFSIFDPSNFSIRTAWILPNIIVWIPLLVINSKIIKLFSKFFRAIWNEIFTITKSVKATWYVIPLFQLFLLINLFSILPSRFCITAQIAVVLPIGVIAWFTTIIYAISHKLNSLLSHLTPEGSPIVLSPFLVIIEIVSNIIRPITISVRLIANITAGHLLIHLLREFVCHIYPLSFVFLPVSLILTTLELIVCLIQAYIFCALLSIYSREVH